MKNSTKKIIISAGVLSTVAAVAVGTAYLSGRLLVTAAIRRDGIKVKLPRKIQSRISGGLVDDPKVNEIYEAAERVKALPMENVQVVSDDGLNLKGRIYSCEEPKRIILAMHGWRSNWRVDFGGSIDFYHDEHCIMVMPDQRGTNDSDGDYIGFGVLEKNDCINWINYIIERYGTELPIYLLGVSMGATTVLMASGSELPESVNGIIADCGFTSPHAIWKHVLDNNLKIAEKVTYPIANAIIKREANYDGDEYSTLDALAVNTKPVLFIHGSDDKFVPLKMTCDNYLATVAPKDLLIVPGAGHGMSCIIDPVSYQNRVREFFKKCENNEWDV